MLDYRGTNIVLSFLTFSLTGKRRHAGAGADLRAWEDPYPRSDLVMVRWVGLLLGAVTN